MSRLFDSGLEYYNNEDFINASINFRKAFEIEHIEKAAVYTVKSMINQNYENGEFYSKEYILYWIKKCINIFGETIELIVLKNHFLNKDEKLSKIIKPHKTLLNKGLLRRINKKEKTKKFYKKAKKLIFNVIYDLRLN